MHIHLRGVALGAALAIGGAILLSAQASPIQAGAGVLGLRILGTVATDEVEPHPLDYITVEEGTPYVVPPSKVFVLTGLGTILTWG
jgi:hypothetical protein